MCGMFLGFNARNGMWGGRSADLHGSIAGTSNVRPWHWRDFSMNGEALGRDFWQTGTRLVVLFSGRSGINALLKARRSWFA